jgi:squalene-hopene/tetraprenyl-beta-curcumene cyclase
MRTMLLRRPALLAVPLALSLALVATARPVAAGSQANGAKAEQATVGPDAEQLKKLRRRAIDFLRTTQADDGSWTTPTAPGIGALVTTALLQNGLPPDDPTVARALKHLESFIQDDGGIYYEKTPHRNYETCIALLAFHEANADGRYDEAIANADKFLRRLQWDEDEGLEPSDPAYGGAGYGRHQRPDMSNTQFLIEALRAAGADEDDPAIQKALVFVSRCQNLETEHNTTPHAARVNDGGFYYTPAAGGESQAGLTPDGGLRSYGSMTYAGLKSMIHAGLTSEDPRVKAAFTWIQRFYTVDENPGLGQHGLYYYFHTFAKALATLDIDYLEDAEGVKHDWRRDMADKLAELQRSNGSWVNRAERWYEGDPNLSTAYGLLALGYCDPKPVSEPSDADDADND